VTVRAMRTAARCLLLVACPALPWARDNDEAAHQHVCTPTRVQQGGHQHVSPLSACIPRRCVCTYHMHVCACSCATAAQGCARAHTTRALSGQCRRSVALRTVTFHKTQQGLVVGADAVQQWVPAEPSGEVLVSLQLLRAAPPSEYPPVTMWGLPHAHDGLEVSFAPSPWLVALWHCVMLHLSGARRWPVSLPAPILIAVEGGWVQVPGTASHMSDDEDMSDATSVSSHAWTSSTGSRPTSRPDSGSALAQVPQIISCCDALQSSCHALLARHASAL
jgi:hypothetical protein